MLRTVLPVVLLLAAVGPSPALGCGSIVASVCGEDSAEPRRLSVPTAPPAYATGDRFPVEERSLLMNPTRHRLPPVDGAWRYYAMDGTVYRVDNATATVLEVIRDRRTWGLR